MSNIPLWKWNLLVWVLCAWTFLWWGYNYFVRRSGFHPMGTKIFDMPHVLKCSIKQVSKTPEKNTCENAFFDGWSVGHILIYISIGLIIPNHYLLIACLSVLCEVFEYMVGWRARWLVDPVVNLVGYVIGCGLAAMVTIQPLAVMQSLWSTAAGALLLTVLLICNVPKRMAHPMT